MKKPFQFFLLAILIVVAAMPSTAQITIRASDVASSLAPGITIISRIDTAQHSINIGTLGASSWDFSALTSNYSSSATTVRPDTTQFFSYFPSATHAIKIGTLYSYYALSTNFDGLGVAQAQPTQIRVTDIPPQILEQLPMTIGSNWTTSYAESSYVTISGTTYGSVSNAVVNYTVDAYGSLTLPGGSVRQMLRLKTDRHTTAGAFTYRSITYQFLAADGTSFNVVPSDTNQPETGKISATSTSWTIPGAPTSVEEIPARTVPSSFTLQQNYPNPFNPTTTIEFQVSKARFVTLKIYNLLGQEVATLVSGILQPGRYRSEFNANTLPSGTYVYRLQAGAFFEEKKLMLMK